MVLSNLAAYDLVSARQISSSVPQRRASVSHLIRSTLDRLANDLVHSVGHVDLSRGLLQHAERLDERHRHALRRSPNVKILHGAVERTLDQLAPSLYLRKGWFVRPLSSTSSFLADVPFRSHLLRSSSTHRDPKRQTGPTAESARRSIGLPEPGGLQRYPSPNGTFAVRGEGWGIESCRADGEEGGRGQRSERSSAKVRESVAGVNQGKPSRARRSSRQTHKPRSSDTEGAAGGGRGRTYEEVRVRGERPASVWGSSTGERSCCRLRCSESSVSWGTMRERLGKLTEM